MNVTYTQEDTIAALATPPGVGAVAIVRLSGPDALSIGRRLGGIEPEPRRASVCTFRDPEGRRIDQGLMLFFRGPKSFTGEDVVELHGHGGMVVSDWLLGSAYRLGARAAQPGEFTMRAFLNGKLDLAQAEAIADLVASGSRQAVQAALRSLDGRFSSSVHALQRHLTDLRVQLEAWLDFPEEELPVENTTEIEKRLDELEAQMGALVAEAKMGRVLRDGFTVVIAGPPNAGKSSLMNQLAGYEAAIVTHIPGTTRDPLREHLSLDGLPVSVTDTAGLRDSEDPVEVEGVRRAQKELARADRVLWVTDIRSELNGALRQARTELGGEMALTLIRNKVDLVSEKPSTFEHSGTPVIHLSALTGEGLTGLIEHLKNSAGYTGEIRGAFSARARHVDALNRARDHTVNAQTELAHSGALELCAEELRLAQTALSELTGELTSDDLLGEIFSSFCIGK